MKKSLYIAIVIALAAVVINFSLGGFDAVEQGLITSDKVVIYGQEYEGRYNSKTLDELLNKFRTTLDNNQGQGRLTIVNYHQPELEQRGTVKQFVGIIWEGRPLQNNYDSLVVEAYNGAQFRIPVKPIVMPSPEKLRDQAVEMAIEMSTSLAGYSVEQYEDKMLIINFPFKAGN